MLHEEYPAKQEPRDASTPGAVADYEGVDVSNPNQPSFEPPEQRGPDLPNPMRPPENAQYAQGGAVPPVKKAKRFGWPTVIVTALIATTIGVAVTGTTGATTAGPSATVTARPTATQTIYKTAGQPTAEATEAPTAGYTPHKSDWKIGIKILTNKCFDTAGASITYRIKPEFVGAVAPPADGTVEVSYRVSGGEGGPSDNTFTVTGGQMSYDKEEDVDTPSCSTKLKVKVTDVSYDG